MALHLIKGSTGGCENEARAAVKSMPVSLRSKKCDICVIPEAHCVRKGAILFGFFMVVLVCTRENLLENETVDIWRCITLTLMALLRSPLGVNDHSVGE